MKRFLVIVALFLALTACVSSETTPPVASTMLPTLPSAAPTAEVEPTASATPLTSPTLDPTIERPDTPEPPLTPVPSATPSPSGFAPPGPLLPGFGDGLVFVAADGALVVYYPETGRVETLLGTNYYRSDSDDSMVATGWPPRFSPDGRQIIVPRPAGDTWLVERGTAGETAVAAGRRIHHQRLLFTWSPDGRIAFTAGRFQFPDVSGGEVYVQDVVAGAEPAVLAELPLTSYWPVWSPGCAAPDAAGDCGRSIAVMVGGDQTWAIWLVDATTGEARELGPFQPPPIGGSLWHRWTADGAGVIAQADGGSVFFPLDGPPRPLVVEQGVAPRGGYPAPGGVLYARPSYNPEYYEFFIGDAATGEEVALPQRYDMVEVQGWTGNGRYALAHLRQGEANGIYAVDVSAWPVLGEPVLVADAEMLIGIESAMQAQSTEVDPRPWATVEPLPAAGPVENWVAREWPAAHLSPRVPAGWRFEPVGPFADAILANYNAMSGGLVALSDEQFRADLTWSYYTADLTLDYSVTSMSSMYFYKAVSAFEAGDVSGVVLRDPVMPVCETILVPYDAEGYHGELRLNYCPATERWRAFMVEFVSHLGLPAADAP